MRPPKRPTHLSGLLRGSKSYNAFTILIVPEPVSRGLAVGNFVHNRLVGRLVPSRIAWRSYRTALVSARLRRDKGKPLHVFPALFLGRSAGRCGFIDLTPDRLDAVGFRCRIALTRAALRNCLRGGGCASGFEGDAAGFPGVFRFWPLSLASLPHGFSRRGGDLNLISYSCRAGRSCEARGDALVLRDFGGAFHGRYPVRYANRESVRGNGRPCEPAANRPFQCLVAQHGIGLADPRSNFRRVTVVP